MDEEKQSFKSDEKNLVSDLVCDVKADETSKLDIFARKVGNWLSQRGLEGHGIEPVPVEQRTDTRLYQMFFVWFTANANILTFGAGSVGPAVYGLGIRDSFLVILVVDIIACIFPAFFVVLGPKLGARVMVQSRFSWGYYGATIPSVLNVLSMQGYVIINCIIGGQTLASVSPHLTAAAGIVITGLIALTVTFCGYQVLHWYEMIAWIPNVVAFIVMFAVGGKTLAHVPITGSVPVTVSSIMSFGSALGVTVVSWSTIAPDYGIFHDAKASSMRIFIYAYLGFFVSSLPVHMIGAAFTAAADYVPSWDEGLGGTGNVGGLFAAILAPSGGFGKFLLVLIALTTPSAIAPTMYTVCTSFMTVASIFSRIPRCVFAVISTAILIPVGIIGASHFYATFVQILSLIGYWIAPFTAIIMTEHFVFRRGQWSAYEMQVAWNKPEHRNLSRGSAATFTFFSSLGLIVACMAQEWWTGPVARSGTGDIAMLVSFVYSVAIFSIARRLEERWTGKARRSEVREVTGTSM